MERSQNLQILQHAIVIGIDEYDDHHIDDLTTAVNDAKGVAEILEKKFGYDVDLKINGATRDDLNEYFLRISDAKHWKGQQNQGEKSNCREHLVVYFAGHGEKSGSSRDKVNGFLVPADARAKEPYSYYPMKNVFDSVAARNPHHLLVIMDCCYAGSFLNSISYRSLPFSGYLYREQYYQLLDRPAWYLLSSAAYNQLAISRIARETGMQENHSPFAFFLLEGLSGKADMLPIGGNGIVTTYELYQYIRDQYFRLPHVLEQIGLDPEDYEFPEPCLFALPGHRHGEFLFPIIDTHFEPAPKLLPERNPYKGLYEYEEGDSTLFCGREDDVTALIVGEPEDKGEDRFLGIEEWNKFSVILAPSGQGKSSLIRAGLIPKLNSELYRKTWYVLGVLVPSHTRPSEILRWLEGIGGDLMVDIESNNPIEAVQSAVTTLVAKFPRKKVLIVFDQLEEIVTQFDEDEREQYLGIILALIQTHTPNVRVLLSLWDDFEAHFKESIIGQYWKPNCIFCLNPISRAKLREVVRRPAEELGMSFFPPDLVERIITDSGKTSNSLPYLSFVLSEIFDECIKKVLSTEIDPYVIDEVDYEKIGNVAGTLRKKADETFEDLAQSGLEQDVKRIVLRMIAFVGKDIVRRSVWRSSLYLDEPGNKEKTDLILEKFRKARLFYVRNERNPQNVSEDLIEPAHDALIRGWPMLNQWVKDYGLSELKFAHQIIEAARKWNGRGRSQSDLIRNREDLKFAKRITEIRNPVWELFALKKRLK